MTDSGAHKLGGCTHPTMKGMYINRHNQATRLIAECLHNGRHRGGLMIMDAGKTDNLPQYCHGTHIPGWMLPHLTKEEISCLRPDILFIPTLALWKTKNRHYRGPQDKKQHVAYIIEVGYTGELQHTEKQNMEQHAKLKEELTKAGWTVCYNDAQIVTLGSTGTLPKSLTPMLCQLGVHPEQAIRTSQNIHQQTVDMAGTIIHTRRVMENTNK
ncbi:hypothetical protein Vafri_16905 [Volvox africanus]|uniref:Uncharacterized protein n=1 Tax=Volvox africanus TaxID=51714 RepID=A0A8J4BPG4_9CHLO|nr:hypothetical protein Vafri_16905 [Volvox africanus]